MANLWFWGLSPSSISQHVESQAWLKFQRKQLCSFPSTVKVLIRWSPRIAPLVKTGLTISQHGESQLHESSFNWNNWAAFLDDVIPHRRRNECHTNRSYNFWWQKGAIWFIQSGKDWVKWMNVGRNLGKASKKNTELFGNFSQHRGGRGLLNPKTFVIWPSNFWRAKIILRC